MRDTVNAVGRGLRHKFAALEERQFDLARGYRGAATTVAVVFATDDGNPASSLTVTSGLTTLPPGWSGPAELQCAGVSAGTDCRLTLVYEPTTAVANGALTLGFSYP